MKNIKSLTGLRFLAALYVFLFHLHVRTPFYYLHHKVGAIFQQGALGVTLFFILSGFVLTYSNLKDFKKPEIKSVFYVCKFMFKRLARIYPLYLTGLIICLCVSVYFKKLPTLKVFFLNLTFLQTYFKDFVWSWYSGAWSVSNEIFFYLLFPIVLPILLLIERKKYLIALIFLLAIFGSIVNSISNGLLASPLPFPFPYSWAYWFPLFRLPEFITGIITGILVFKFNWKIQTWIAISLLIITTIHIAFIGPRILGTLTHNWIFLPTIVSLLSVLSQPKQSILFKWLESKPLQYLGKISYAFYIFQLPILFAIDELLKTSKISQTNWLVPPITFIINLTGAIIIHELIEKKAHRFFINGFNRRFNKAQETLTPDFLST